MSSKSILLPAVLVFSAFGCDDALTELPGPDGPHVENCPDQRRICTEDTVCMEDTCRPAFDRDYKVRLNLSYPGKDCPEWRDCPPPLVRIFHDDGNDPILTSVDPKVAQVHVVEDSWLTAAVNGHECTIDLTTERLQRGKGTCTVGGMSVTLQLDPMPSDGDAAF